eukprot:TRINITY_DN14674_c6_g1_i1.p1 TRINITY_DN14674_c6_g1~~TRINITY_DN14674_c6_g1_i1.p1  ORF type:complete len:193 (+),score=28.66 TRINITY_DN14674_c6_g1_i1:92-670(+)
MSRLEDCVASVPVHPGCVTTIQHASEQADQIILSDANTVFIQSFLEKAHLRHNFKEIISNPAEFDPDGRLHINPYHSGEPHNCPLCPPNLCKGKVLDQLRSSLQPAFIIYVGDGGGDFCPACELRAGDAVLCRTPPSPPLNSFGLHRRITQTRNGETLPSRREGVAASVAADVRPWHSGEDVLTIVTEILSG